MRDLHRLDVAPLNIHLPWRTPPATGGGKPLHDPSAVGRGCAIAIAIDTGPNDAAVAMGRNICTLHCAYREGKPEQHAHNPRVAKCSSDGTSTTFDAVWALEQTCHVVSDDVISLAVGGAHCVAALRNGELFSAQPLRARVSGS